jgi:hypothetical protein
MLRAFERGANLRIERGNGIGDNCADAAQRSLCRVLLLLGRV